MFFFCAFGRTSNAPGRCLCLVSLGQFSGHEISLGEGLQPCSQASKCRTRSEVLWVGGDGWLRRMRNVPNRLAALGTLAGLCLHSYLGIFPGLFLSIFKFSTKEMHRTFPAVPCHNVPKNETWLELFAPCSNTHGAVYRGHNCHEGRQGLRVAGFREKQKIMLCAGLGAPPSIMRLRVSSV